MPRFEKDTDSGIIFKSLMLNTTPERPFPMGDQPDDFNAANINEYICPKTGFGEMMKFFDTTKPALVLTLIVLSLVWFFPVKAQEKNPRNVIIIQAGGMGFDLLNAAERRKNGLNMKKFPVAGIMTTGGTTSTASDEASATTAIATGTYTKPGHVGVDKNGNKVHSALELAMESGKTTGLLTTGVVTQQTLAPWYAHRKDYRDMEALATDLSLSGVNVIIGGGRRFFKDREDEKNLVKVFHAKDYQVVEKARKLGRVREDKLLALVADQHLPGLQKRRENYLQDAWESAFKSMVRNEKGFFLVVDNPLISWSCMDENYDKALAEVLAMDQLAGAIWDYARSANNTLVIVTGIYEAGGLFFQQKGNNLQPGWNDDGITVKPVPVLAYGPGAGHFTGFYDRTRFFEKLKKAMGF